MLRQIFSKTNKRRNLLIGIVCVGALLALGANYWEKGSALLRNDGVTAPAPAPAVGPEKTKWEIEIFDTEYRPKMLVVHKGETVTWTNKGTRGNWPASDNHPTHGKYPAPGGCIGSKFDACKGLAPGESFTFQFDRTGVWNYHDHLAPGLVGTIDVEP